MLKPTLKFVNLFLIAFIVLTACTGKEMPKEKTVKQSSDNQEEQESGADTVWMVDVDYTYFESPDFTWDEHIEIEGKQYTLYAKSETLPNKYVGIQTYAKDGELHAQKYTGPNSLFTFELYDSLDNVVAQKSWDKYQLEQYLPKDLLAGSRGDRWYFNGYYREFGQLMITTPWMFEESDVGEEFILFMDIDLTIKDFFLDANTGGGACDCNYDPSEDGKTFAFCSRIYRSNGSHKLLDVVDTDVAGSFALNNGYSLVIEMFEGKPPYKNAKLMDGRGVVTKSFDFTGIDEGLGYLIPTFEVPDQNALFLLDDQKRCLYRIAKDAPNDLQVLQIDSFKKMEEGEVLNQNSVGYVAVGGARTTFYFEYRNGEFNYYAEH